MKPIFLLLFSFFVVMAGPVQARDQIRVVGSSTVFPFVASAAERFGRRDDYATPIVESTGTGGGIKLFCSGVGEAYPDMSNASRPIKDSEIKLCAENGVTEIVELPIGFDGIVLANAKESHVFNLTKQHLFLALAHEVPKDGKLMQNPYQSWKEIDAALPDVAIAVYGPPPTSGTRDAFVEMVMEEACEHFPEYEMTYKDKNERKKHCVQMREDGRFIEAGENDNLIVQKLTGNRDALGIFGYSFLEQNSGLVKANPVGGVEPTFGAIADGSYGIARSLFVYVKRQNNESVEGLNAFAQEFTSDAAVGDDGYLILKGLIPLPHETHEQVKAIAKDLTPME